jgi:molybdopterin synthase sulfur carrier subunit
MAKLEFLGPINREPMIVDISNLRELKEILNKDEALSEWLENSAVAVNDVMVASLDIEVGEKDKISILPPVCGG